MEKLRTVSLTAIDQEKSLVDEMFGGKYPLAIAHRARLEPLLRIIDEVLGDEELDLKILLFQRSLLEYRLALDANRAKNISAVDKAIRTIGKMFNLSADEALMQAVRIKNNIQLEYNFYFGVDPEVNKLPPHIRRHIALD